MTLDDDLVRVVDRMAKRMHTTRSAFTRTALREALRRINTAHLESKHRKGYEIFPVEEGEFGVREEDRAWGDA
jgi:metal-responsive CopG/Arc/MetJ family transcriptional regulator